MKREIKKIKLPLNKMTGNEKGYAAALMEEMKIDLDSNLIVANKDLKMI